MQVTVREGEDVLLHDLEVGSTGTDLFPKQTGMVAAVVNGVSVDLATELHEGDQIGGVHISSAEGLAILRHSAAHVAAQATQKLIPSAKLGIGPPIPSGSVYSSDVSELLQPEVPYAIY